MICLTCTHYLETSIGDYCTLTKNICIDIKKCLNFKSCNTEAKSNAPVDMNMNKSLSSIDFTQSHTK